MEAERDASVCEGCSNGPAWSESMSEAWVYPAGRDARVHVVVQFGGSDTRYLNDQAYPEYAEDERAVDAMVFWLRNNERCEAERPAGWRKALDEERALILAKARTGVPA